MSGSGSHTKADSRSTTDPLNPQQVSGYFNELNRQTNGRLGRFAQQGGDRPVYDPLTRDELRGVGSVGASREANLSAQRSDSLTRIGSDPALDATQKTRAAQLANNGYDTLGKAIGQENEAAISAILAQENDLKYQADRANVEQAIKEFFELQNIYYGGKGESSDFRDHTISRGGGGGAK